MPIPSGSVDTAYDDDGGSSTTYNTGRPRGGGGGGGDFGALVRGALDRRRRKEAHDEAKRRRDEKLARRRASQVKSDARREALMSRAGNQGGSALSGPQDPNAGIRAAAEEAQLREQMYASQARSRPAPTVYGRYGRQLDTMNMNAAQRQAFLPGGSTMNPSQRDLTAVTRAEADAEAEAQEKADKKAAERGG